MAAIFLSGWFGNARHAAVKRSKELDRLTESGARIQHSGTETFDTYWFGEIAKQPVVSIEQATQKTEPHENWFDLAQVPELRTLVLFDDHNLSTKTAKALVNLQVLEFRKKRSDAMEKSFYLKSEKEKIDDYQCAAANKAAPDDVLVSDYADALPVMPKLESLSVTGDVETLMPPVEFSHNEGSRSIWLVPVNDGEKRRLFTVEDGIKFLESGELANFQGRWIKGSDLHTFLKKAPNLKHVDIALYDVTQAAIGALAEKTTLESASINLYDVSPKMYFKLTKALLDLPNLKSLDIEYPPRSGHFDLIRKAYRQLRTDFVLELNKFETLRVSKSNLESISLTHIAKLEIVDCPNLETISSVEGAGGAKLVVKRCNKLMTISVPVLDLHCEDCPSLIGEFQKSLSPNSRKMFFKNVAALQKLEVDSLDDLTVEGKLNVASIKIGDYHCSPHLQENTNQQNSNSLPVVSAKTVKLESLSPATIKFLEQISPLNSLRLNMLAGSGATGIADRGWTPENMSALFEKVSTKGLIIYSCEPIEMKCFERLHQCDGVTNICFAAPDPYGSDPNTGAGLRLADFVTPAAGGSESGAKVPLGQRWNLKLPETVKSLYLHYNPVSSRTMDTEGKYVKFLAQRYPQLEITHWASTDLGTRVGARTYSREAHSQEN